eukprot:6196060-Pleurochrysis_carterae.AAC.1
MQHVRRRARRAFARCCATHVCFWSGEASLADARALWRRCVANWQAWKGNRKVALPVQPKASRSLEAERQHDAWTSTVCALRSARVSLAELSRPPPSAGASTCDHETTRLKRASLLSSPCSSSFAEAVETTARALRTRSTRARLGATLQRTQSSGRERTRANGRTVAAEARGLQPQPLAKSHAGNH